MLRPSKNQNFLIQSIEMNMKKVVVKILRGSVVTQNMLGELTILQSAVTPVSYIVCTKNYESWLSVNKKLQ